MANRKRLDHKGRPCRKLDAVRYEGSVCFNIKNFPKWRKRWGKRGNLNKFHELGKWWW